MGISLLLKTYLRATNITCHIGSDTDLRAHINPSQTSRYLICLPHRDERLS